MNPANDNATLDEDLAEANAQAAKVIMDQPVRGSELKDVLPVIEIPRVITLNEHASGFEDAS